MQFAAKPGRFLRQLAVALSVSQLLVGSHPALARPLTEPESGDLVNRVPASNPYPDLQGCRDAHQASSKPSVFFSNLDPKNQADRDKPDTFAASIGGQTFKLAFGTQPSDSSKPFTDRRTGAGSRTFYKQFARDFSQAFAEKATGIAYVLLRDTTGADGPRSDSVWTVVERPALEANTAVSKIVKVDPKDLSQTDLWVRPAASKVKRAPPASGVFSLDWDTPGDGPYWLAPGE